MNSHSVCTGLPFLHATKYFCHSHVDKRTIEGLLARGNKAKALHSNNGGDTICTRTFVSCFPIVACHASTVPHLTRCKLHNTQCVSTKIDPSPLSAQSNDIVENRGMKHRG